MLSASNSSFGPGSILFLALGQVGRYSHDRVDLSKVGDQQEWGNMVWGQNDW